MKWRKQPGKRPRGKTLFGLAIGVLGPVLAQAPHHLSYTPSISVGSTYHVSTTNDNSPGSGPAFPHHQAGRGLVSLDCVYIKAGRIGSG
jgi:hypothetical protein